MRTFQQADDGRQPRIVAERLDLNREGAFDIQCARGDQIANGTCLGQVFAGEHRFVDARLAGADASVGGDQRAGLYQYLVTDAQFAEQDAHALAVLAQLQTGCRQQVDQLRRRRCGAFAGAALEKAAGKQEQREHAHRVEIEFALAGDGRPDAGKVCATDGQ